MYPIVEIFGMRFPTYMLCAGLGAIVSVSKLSSMLQRRLILRKYISKILLSLIGLFVGAKIFGVIGSLLYHYKLYARWLVVESIKQSGIVYLGGLLGFIFSLKVICLRQKADFSEIKDDVAVVIPLFHTFGRIGCFFSGCCYGKNVDSVFFTSLGMERLPIQLYEAMFEFILFLLLNLEYSRKNKTKIVNKDLMRIYLLIYSIWRFIVEFWRDDSVRGFFLFLSLSQVLSIIIILATIFNMLKCKKWRI